MSVSIICFLAISRFSLLRFSNIWKLNMRAPMNFIQTITPAHPDSPFSVIEVGHALVYCFNIFLNAFAMTVEVASFGSVDYNV